MKQITRSVSLFLSCIMALCVFTSCSGGTSTIDNTPKDLITYLGASNGIQTDSSLKSAANIILSQFQIDGTLVDVDVDYNTAFELYSRHFSRLGRIVYYDMNNQTKSTAYVEYTEWEVTSDDLSDPIIERKIANPTQGALSSYISGMKRYGKSSTKTIVYEGTTYNITVMFVAR